MTVYSKARKKTNQHFEQLAPFLSDESDDPSDETFDVKEELVLMIEDISVNFVTQN